MKDRLAVIGLLGIVGVILAGGLLGLASKGIAIPDSLQTHLSFVLGALASFLVRRDQ
jgi:putative flippase GtrA